MSYEIEIRDAHGRRLMITANDAEVTMAAERKRQMLVAKASLLIDRFLAKD